MEGERDRTLAASLRWPSRVLALALATLVAAGAAAGGADAAKKPPKERWRVGWATAIDDLSAESRWNAHPTVPGTPTEAGTTFRFVVLPTIAGSKLKLRLSNVRNGMDQLAGTQPVTFGAVRVGVRARGAAVRRGTNRRVTFRGKRRLTLGPGGVAVSDPVKLRVKRLRALVVSLYVPVSTQPPMHAQTFATQFRTPGGAGNHAGDRAAGSFTQLQEPIFWLDGLYVRSRARRAIVAIGDSIVDGDQANGPGAPLDYSDDNFMDRNLPYRLSQRGSSNRKLATTAVINSGENGEMSAGGVLGSTGLASRLQHDVFSLPRVTHVAISAGTFDLTYGSDAATVISNLTGIARALRQRGKQVIGITLPPRNGYPLNTPAMSVHREQINAFIRSSRLFAGVLDVAQILGRPGDDNTMRPEYDSGDHLHPNTAGYQEIANAFRFPKAKKKKRKRK